MRHQDRRRKEKKYRNRESWVEEVVGVSLKIYASVLMRIYTLRVEIKKLINRLKRSFLRKFFLLKGSLHVSFLRNEYLLKSFCKIYMKKIMTQMY